MARQAPHQPRDITSFSDCRAEGGVGDRDGLAHPAPPAETATGLGQLFKLDGAAPAEPASADALIRRALTAAPRIVVVDEADRVPEACFEYLRFLHDDLPGGLCTVWPTTAKPGRAFAPLTRKDHQHGVDP